MEMNIRLKSLDFYRGFTVAGMILVNNPGTWSAVHAPLRHAEWHGCTPTDLVFPFFLFIVGVSIVFSMSSRKADKSQHPTLIKKIIKRSLILIGLGLFLNGFPYFPLESLRFPGVLQRIGVVFFFAAIIFLKTNWKGQIWTIVCILTGYWLLMMFVPVPGHGASNLEPGTNLAAWVDSILLKGHMWEATETWDPEGVLSTFPAICTSLIGILVGQWLRSGREKGEMIAWLFVAGCGLVVAGLVWDWHFPINKALWTSSYVLYTAGLGINCLAFCYWLIDVQGYQKGVMPFVAFGTNAITAYFLSGIVARLLGLIHVGDTSLKSWIFTNFFDSWLSTINASLVAGLVGVLLFYIPIQIMYNKKIFIKV